MGRRSNALTGKRIANLQVELDAAYARWAELDG